MAALLAFALSVSAAVLPTVAYVAAFYWADRYEREPVTLLLAAFVWGAIPAVMISLIGEVLLGSPFVSDDLSLEAALIEGAMIAPVVEEVVKALALWGLYRWRRDEFDGPLDGLIYGALIGFGFAMTENFFYFIGAFAEGGFLDLTVVIVLRSVVFGLNHALYTGLTGLGFGLARGRRSRITRALYICAGLGAAIVVHSLHNLGSALSSITFAGFGLSLFIAAGGASLILITVLLSWSHERSIICTELADEVGVIITAQELAQLTGHWRQPLYPREKAQAGRLALSVELALRKSAHRRAVGRRAAEIQEEIARLRSLIAQA